MLSPDFRRVNRAVSQKPPTLVEVLRTVRGPRAEAGMSDRRYFRSAAVLLPSLAIIAALIAFAVLFG